MFAIKGFNIRYKLTQEHKIGFKNLSSDLAVICFVTYQINMGI